MFLAAIVGAVALWWALDAPDGSGRRMTLSDSAEFGRKMFVWLSFLLMTGAALLTPAVTADLLTGEKKANTLGLLLLTRLSPVIIVRDKALSRIAYMGQLVVLCMPFLFICMMFGGVSSWQIVAVVGSIFAIILTGLAAGLFFSTVLQNYVSALCASYAFMFAYLLVLPTAIGMALAFIRGAEIWLAFASPFMALVLIVEPRFITGPELEALKSAWTGPLGAGLVMLLASVVICTRLLPRHAELRPAAASRGGLTGLASASAWKVLLSVPVLPFIFLAEIFERRRGIGRNPVLWREAAVTKRSGRLATVYVSGVILYLFAGILAICAASGNINLDVLYQIAVAFFVFSEFFLFLAASVTSAVSLTQEREEGTFEVLISTALRTRHIVLGKFLGVLRSCAVLAVFPAVFAVIAGASGRVFPGVVALSIAFLLLQAAGVSAMAVYFSAVSSTSVKAAGLAIVGGIVALVAPMVATAVLADVFGNSRAFEEVLFSLGPGVLPATLLADTPYKMAAPGTLLLSAFAFVSIGLLSLLAATHRLNSETGREGGGSGMSRWLGAARSALSARSR